MIKEIGDIYMLILSISVRDFKRKYSDWPKGDVELWTRNRVIDYGDVRKFLDGTC